MLTVHQMASWLPFDAASQAIIDIALSKSAPALAMNLVHPHPVEWNTIMHWFADAMREQGITAKPLPLVDVQTWVEELTAASHGATDETLRRLVSNVALRWT
jgi:NAD dependent epimerase/dehydratase family enzyme